MKKMPLFVCSMVVAVAGYSTAALAEQPYVGIDYQLAKVKSDEASVNLGNVLLRAGTKFDKYWGFEVQAAFGVKDDAFKGTDGNTYKVKGNGQYAAFLKPQTDIDDHFSLYLLLGANYTDIKQTGPSGSEHGNFGTKFAAGAGVNLFLTQHVGVGVEYVHYDTNIDAVNAGLRYRF